MDQSYWRRCGPCKREIQFGQDYVKCSVSACRKHVFCSEGCFSAHSALERHREAWAEDERAPTLAEAQEAAAMPRKRVVVSSSSSSGSSSKNDVSEKDILIVASKLKLYIKNSSGLNTSASVMERLSDIVRGLCDQAVERAKNDARKTVMDRDF